MTFMVLPSQPLFLDLIKIRPILQEDFKSWLQWSKESEVNIKVISCTWMRATSSKEELNPPLSWVRVRSWMTTTTQSKLMPRQLEIINSISDRNSFSNIGIIAYLPTLLPTFIQKKENKSFYQNKRTLNCSNLSQESKLEWLDSQPLRHLQRQLLLLQVLSRLINSFNTRI